MFDLILCVDGSLSPVPQIHPELPTDSYRQLSGTALLCIRCNLATEQPETLCHTLVDAMRAMRCSTLYKSPLCRLPVGHRGPGIVRVILSRLLHNKATKGRSVVPIGIPPSTRMTGPSFTRM